MDFFAKIHLLLNYYGYRFMIYDNCFAFRSCNNDVKLYEQTHPSSLVIVMKIVYDL